MNHDEQGHRAPTIASFLKRRWTEATIVATAAAIRFFHLGSARPVHGDEAANIMHIDKMIAEGGWHVYDPTNYHGQSYFMFLRWSIGAFGFNEFALRVPSAVMGVLCVCAAFSFRRFIGRAASLWSGAFLALSSAQVYWSRHSIHETTFCLSLMVATWGVAELSERFSKAGVRALFAGLALAALTKETWLIHAIALVLAVVAAWAAGRFRKERRAPIPFEAATFPDVLLAAGWAALAVVFVLSRGFHDISAVSGLWKTYFAWGRHSVEVQIQPWHWFVSSAARFDTLAVSMIPCAVALPLMARVRRSWRVIALSGLAALCGYSLLKYKTPWCLVVILWPFSLVFGVLAARLAERAKAYGAVAAACVAFTGAQAVGVALLRPADPANFPYVFWQAGESLVGAIDKLRSHPEWKGKKGMVYSTRTVPLSWYLHGGTAFYLHPPAKEHSEYAEAHVDEMDYLVEDAERRSLVAGFEEGWVSFRFRTDSFAQHDSILRLRRSSFKNLQSDQK